MTACVCCLLIITILACIVIYSIVKFHQVLEPDNPPTSNSSNVPDDGCLCKTYSCGCCVTLEVPEILLNDTGCVNVAYLPDEYGIAVTLTIDGQALINETISARNPPPLCMEPPELDVYLHICLRFYDLSIKGSTFHSCVQIEFKMFYIFTLTEIKLGCFNLGVTSPKDAQHLLKLISVAERNTNSSKSLDANQDWRAFKQVLDTKMVEFWKVVLNKTVGYEKVVETEVADSWKIVSSEMAKFGKAVEKGTVDFGEDLAKKAMEFELLMENKISDLGRSLKIVKNGTIDYDGKVESQTEIHEKLIEN